ncbi:hypothetical protein L211DRAFT_842055 [Terfezia boudieri ATCC MYA-4762]|uniref:Uncharacterized protein n=1 Tax=Terfezia boudieri ATCC MYA-4762 TaxID=1051890 RepID=A0A3N4LFB9_9PEZI|nr:hypothetical protein L211DRAFT_842055 [Terfezia boudieri ATCC MYA-4762]
MIPPIHNAPERTRSLCRYGKSPPKYGYPDSTGPAFHQPCRPNLTPCIPPSQPISPAEVSKAEAGLATPSFLLPAAPRYQRSKHTPGRRFGDSVVIVFAARIARRDRESVFRYDSAAEVIKGVAFAPTHTTHTTHIWDRFSQHFAGEKTEC